MPYAVPGAAREGYDVELSQRRFAAGMSRCAPLRTLQRFRGGGCRSYAARRPRPKSQRVDAKCPPRSRGRGWPLGDVSLLRAAAESWRGPALEEGSRWLRF